MTHIHVAQSLDHWPPTKHTHSTCGLSRGGGLRTSDCRRWSRLLGRVAVVHVQGSPKVGGALGLLRVLSTRLRPVPPMIVGGHADGRG
jgi:hypothetical protein